MRVTGEAGIALIKESEGLRLKAYRDTGGVLSIGYGHTEDVHEGDEITEHQAEVMLRADLADAERCVQLRFPEANQNQWDACVSFVFNLGCTRFGSSTLLRLIRKGDYNAAAKQFGRWVNDNGVQLPGLVTRRAKEAALFLTPDFSNVQSGAESTAPQPR